MARAKLVPLVASRIADRGFCVTRNMLDRPDLDCRHSALAKLGGMLPFVRPAILEDNALRHSLEFI